MIHKEFDTNHNQVSHCSPAETNLLCNCVKYDMAAFQAKGSCDQNIQFNYHPCVSHFHLVRIHSGLDPVSTKSWFSSIWVFYCINQSQGVKPLLHPVSLILSVRLRKPLVLKKMSFINKRQSSRPPITRWMLRFLAPPSVLKHPWARHACEAVTMKCSVRHWPVRPSQHKDASPQTAGVKLLPRPLCFCVWCLVLHVWLYANARLKALLRPLQTGLRNKHHVSSVNSSEEQI